MTDDWPPVMKISDVARYLQISRSQAYELIRVPNFPVFAISQHRYRVLRASLDAWLRQLPAMVPGDESVACDADGQEEA